MARDSQKAQQRPEPPWHWPGSAHSPSNEVAQDRTVKFKYFLDRIMALLLLVALSPLFLVAALAIKLQDGGRVFFIQERIGEGGSIFKCLKFRTMLADADRFLDREGKPTQNRVTAVGRLLRWASLDELPQLINILRGEMSLVGPRPALPAHLLRYTDRQLGRLRMRPGITGLAQVRGRNMIKWSRRIRYDNWYIDHCHLGLDLWIIFLTIGTVLFRRGIAADRNPDQVDDLAPIRQPPARGDRKHEA